MEPLTLVLSLYIGAGHHKTVSTLGLTESTRRMWAAEVIVAEAGNARCRRGRSRQARSMGFGIVKRAAHFGLTGARPIQTRLRPGNGPSKRRASRVAAHSAAQPIISFRSARLLCALATEKWGPGHDRARA